MYTNDFFKKIALQLNLGYIRDEPIKLTGGLTHSVYKLSTIKGNYVIKLLNQNIMKRASAFTNCNTAENFESILESKKINAIYSLKFNNRKMQQLDNQYFYIYEWYDGKSLKNNEIKKHHCKKIGEVLSKIHNIDLKYEAIQIEPINIDWSYYVNEAYNQNSQIYELIVDKIDMLNDIINKYNINIQKLPDVKSICHNDLDSKNVLWDNDDFKIIDLECLSYFNPYLELLEVALSWSGYEDCNINFELFKAILKSYFEYANLNSKIDWKIIYYANIRIVEWLEFNIKRALMIECTTDDEIELGINEVKKTINKIVYYYEIKDKLINTINEILNI